MMWHSFICCFGTADHKSERIPIDSQGLCGAHGCYSHSQKGHEKMDTFCHCRVNKLDLQFMRTRERRQRDQWGVFRVKLLGYCKFLIKWPRKLFNNSKNVKAYTTRTPIKTKKTSYVVVIPDLLASPNPYFACSSYVS
jgi:hypothetical protein